MLVIYETPFRFISTLVIFSLGYHHGRLFCFILKTSVVLTLLKTPVSDPFTQEQAVSFRGVN